jgi:hypothetical protein
MREPVKAGRQKKAPVLRPVPARQQLADPPPGPE